MVLGGCSVVSVPSGIQHRSLAGGPRCVLLALLVWGAAGCASGATPAEVERIAAALGLEPGMAVADVGAGDGDFAVELARLVGPEGRVIATEVEEEMVRKLRELAEREGLDNLGVVLGSQQRTGLDAGCCDAVLLRMVYHHFEEPGPMRADLRAALKPGGRVVVIDTLPQSGWRVLPGVPDRGGHGIPPEQLHDEMTADGFELVAHIETWNDDDDRFCTVFLRPLAGGEPRP
jgi:ubiquinone/menaquinone biosynthesis C-methylase UbiE